MSATIVDSPISARSRSQDWSPPTADIAESTTDLHEENTTDLTPVTEDVTPTIMPRAENAPEPRAPAPAAREPLRQERRVSASKHSREPPPARARTAPSADAGETEAVETPIVRPPAFAPGAVLNDRYLLEQVIGSGGTSVVYRARDMLSSTNAQPNAQVAIKTPRLELADRARATRRLKHEFDLAKRLAHPNIVRVIELQEDAQRPFMVMELIEGRLLSTLIRDWTMLSPPLARKILRDCAQTLAHAHKHGIVHGDFKPANVFITADEQIKIVDFGAAASLQPGDTARIHAGTPPYASPEVLSGETPEQRDDVFSFACVAYELLTGQHPFDRRSSLQARDEGRVPPRAWSLSATQWLALLSALSWERSQRPADVETLLNTLTAEGPSVADTVPVHAPEAAAAAELPADLMPPQRSWGFFIFIACALIVTLIASQRKLDSPSDGTTMVPPTTVSSAPATTSIASPPPSRPVESSPSPPAETKAAEKETATKEPAAAPAPAAAAAAPAPARAKPAAPASEISFESRSVVTSESSVSAVFLIKRSQPLSGRVRVSWNAVSGTADAGIDFASNAAGSVEFADGQAQRAIYVPLRNDLIKEEDETFTVRLHSAQSARLGSISRVEATIRDDD